VNTDSHNVSHMDNMKFGVITARRGWLEDKDILNTAGAKAVAAKLHGVRA
jgi:DNA polymerase (family 10)